MIDNLLLNAMVPATSQQYNSEDSFTENPAGDFTPPAMSVFQILRDKLAELRIEPDEAREYFRQFTGEIQKIGFIPPLILSFLRDVNGNYQTLVISQHLTAEEEKIIAACLKPNIVGSNEIVPKIESMELVIESGKRIASNSPFTDVLTKINDTVLHYTHNNHRIAQEFTNKARRALEKMGAPLPAIRNHIPQITPAMMEQYLPRVNQAGIRSYLQKQAQAVLQDSPHLPRLN